jgi:NAD(P)-dependent dehydrogenase (short-subunit alcohol dehydrogenase family)
MTMAGKTVLITGAARGIGRVLVRAFLDRGARVVATDLSWAFIDPSEDDVAFDLLTSRGGDVLRIGMDVAIDSHVRRALKLVTDGLGPIDVLINNGGMRARDLYPDSSGMITVLETEVGDWQRMFDTHVFGTLRAGSRQHHQCRHRGTVGWRR